MAYIVQPEAPRRRPGVVTAAVALLVVVALLSMMSQVLQLTTISDVEDVLRDYYADEPNGDTLVLSTTVGSYAGAGFSLVASVALMVLAWLDARGNQPARIMTWVLGGIFMCCSTCGIAGTAFTGVIPGASGTGADQGELQRRMEDAVPTWMTVTVTAEATLSLLLMLTAVIMLALPAANEFFRKPKQEWLPPMPPAPTV
jgi:hypothetical protein